MIASVAKHSIKPAEEVFSKMGVLFLHAILVLSPLIKSDKAIKTLALSFKKVLGVLTALHLSRPRR